MQINSINVLCQKTMLKRQSTRKIINLNGLNKLNILGKEYAIDKN